MRSLTVFAAAAAVFSNTAAAWHPFGGTPSGSCKTFPGDSRWPAAWEWNALNISVGGRLVETVPLGSPCHDPTFDAAQCAALQAEWQLPEIQ